MQLRMNNHEKSLYDLEGKPLAIESGEQLIDLQFESKECASQLQSKLQQFRCSLNSKNAEVFDRRFISNDPDTLQEIADDIGVSRQRIQQIEVLLVEKLKKYLREYK
jgi:DNA-directed RNA polymerase sigma subunit (sigma70/sigma32)